MDVEPANDQVIVVVCQAMGMIAVQADCSLDDALNMICDRATVSRCTIYEIAAATVDRSIHFGE